MRISRVKNIIILTLTALCVVLTMNFWFRGTLNIGSVVRIIRPSSPGQDTYAYASAIRPFRIIVSDVNDEDGFFVRYDNFDTYKIKSESDAAIREVLGKGEFISSNTIDIEKIYSNCIIYEYKFAMPTDVFTQAYSQDTSILTRFKLFNAVAILPGETAADPLKIYFIDYESSMAHEYSVPAYSNNSTLMSSVREESNLYHPIRHTILKSGREGIEYSHFKDGLFVASWIAPSLSYESLLPVIPYEDNGSVRISYVRQQVSYLFNNPGLIQPDNINDSFVFREGDIVVRYFPENVLEYSYYGDYNSKSADTFISAYTAAVSLIERDETLLNEYYLSHYTEQNGTWNFYFDLCENNFPIFLTTIKGTIGMEYAIEVTVTNSTVTKYKRFVYNFITEYDEIVSASLDIINAYRNVYGEPGLDTDIQIKNIDLGYAIDQSSLFSTLKLSLSWFFEAVSIDPNGDLIHISSSYSAR